MASLCDFKYFSVDGDKELWIKDSVHEVAASTLETNLYSTYSFWQGIWFISRTVLRISYFTVWFLTGDVGKVVDPLVCFCYDHNLVILRLWAYLEF